MGMLIDETARSVRPKLPEPCLDLGAGDIEVAHLRKIERYAVLAHLAADRNHLRDARNGEKTRTNDPIHDLPRLHGTCCIASDGDQHDLAHDGGNRRHPRVDVAWQLLAHHTEAL